MKSMLNKSLLLLCVNIYPLAHGAASGLDEGLHKALTDTIIYEPGGARGLLLNGPLRPYDAVIAQRFNELIALIRPTSEEAQIAIAKLHDAHNSLQNNVPEAIGPIHRPERKFTIISLGRSETPTSGKAPSGLRLKAPLGRPIPSRTSLSIPKNLSALHADIKSNPAALLALKQNAEKLTEINDLAQRGNLVARNTLALIKQ